MAGCSDWKEQLWVGIANKVPRRAIRLVRLRASRDIRCSSQLLLLDGGSVVALNSEVNFLAYALGGVTNVDAGQVIWQGSIVGNLCISFYTPIAKSDIEWFEMSDGAITHCPCQPSLR